MSVWDNCSQTSKGWRNDAIAKVHMRIYLGSREEVDLLTFHTHNITHAINCAEDWWSSRWFKGEFPERYTCIGAEDSATFDITSVYPAFEKTVDKYLADPDCQNVYIHCKCGINRSAFLLLMYMCTRFDYSIESVVQTICTQRPCCFQNMLFRKQVEEYLAKTDSFAC